MPTPTFPDRFSALLSRSGISQEQAATHCGKSQNTVSLWVRGDQHPRSVDLVALCSLFSQALATHISADYLLGLADHPSGLQPSGWLIDEDHVEAIRKAETPDDVAGLATLPNGAVVVGVPIPRRPRILASTEYDQLRAELVSQLQRARRKRKK